MKTPALNTSRVAWLLVAALASCSHKQKAAEPPPAPPKLTAAEESQKSFQLATQTQKELTEQTKRVEAAHAAVLTAQQNLAKAQSQEQQERAKAQQLQQRAGQHLQEGVRQAQQAQTGAAGTGGLEGMQTAVGKVIRANSSQVVLQAAGGRPMTFEVDSRTRVLIGTEQLSINDLQQGADAQVAYDPRSGQMTALVIRVLPAEIPPATSAPPGGAEKHR